MLKADRAWPKILAVAAFLYLFLLSISLMGDGFKGFGKDFANALIQTTANPFIGLFIGILVTSIVQSSSTITSVVVGMVAAGIISIRAAVPIIMGANIGTTVTNMFVALGYITRREEFKRAITGAAVHDFFNILCVLILFPLELATGFLQKIAEFLSGIFIRCGGMEFTSPIKAITEPAVHSIEVIFIKFFHLPSNVSYILILVLSLIILFAALFFIVKLMKALVIRKTEAVLDNVIGNSPSLAFTAGVVFTTIVQSSSITTSLMTPLIGAGILTVEAAFPVILGANIGTTTTAILASFATGNPAAISIAFVHFLFNLMGVSVFLPIKIFRQIPIRLAKGLGNLAFKRRRYAIFYVLGTFFILPGLLILISKLFK